MKNIYQNNSLKRKAVSFMSFLFRGIYSLDLTKTMIPALCFLSILPLNAFSNTENKDSIIITQQKEEFRPKIGLVLGGGGAKGAAEVGVLKIIEQIGLPIDYIAGTSIGSIVGGLYACGYRAKEMEEMFMSQEWITLLADRDAETKDHILTRKDGDIHVFGIPVGKRIRSIINNPYGMLDGDNVTQLLDKMAICKDSISFDSLPTPFRCVAVDMKQVREVVLGSGKLSKAMRASMSIPGAYKPVRWDDMVLVDGGMLNNLPVDVVRQMGADIVIAIDLTQNKSKGSDIELEGDSPLGRMMQWAISRPDIKKYNLNCEDADIYINPDLEGFSVAAFSKEKIRIMIERGEIAGKAAIKELEELKVKIGDYSSLQEN